jgi:hypothetical protein
MKRLLLIYPTGIHKKLTERKKAMKTALGLKKLTWENFILYLSERRLKK